MLNVILVILVAFGVVFWIVSGIRCANRASREGLLHPVPELGGIGYCVAVIGGPFGYRMLRR